jgi:hypothetical protein
MLIRLKVKEKTIFFAKVYRYNLKSSELIKQTEWKVENDINGVHTGN